MTATVQPMKAAVLPALRHAQLMSIVLNLLLLMMTVMDLPMKEPVRDLWTLAHQLWFKWVHPDLLALVKEAQVGAVFAEAPRNVYASDQPCAA